jgi:hypothetical protein
MEPKDGLWQSGDVKEEGHHPFLFLPMPWEGAPNREAWKSQSFVPTYFCHCEEKKKGLDHIMGGKVPAGGEGQDTVCFLMG